MKYESYRKNVEEALSKSEKEICEEIGKFIIASAQPLTTVLTGNLKRSETYETMEDGKGVIVGVTEEAKYAPFVEKGTSKQKAQPFLEPATMDNLSKLEEIAQQKIKVNMDGDR